jgi:hypothetical protein
MKHKTLAQKRHAKSLKRKNKKYTGPKYSKLEQMVLLAPLLSKVGIELFADTGFTQKPELKPEFRNVQSTDTNTSFV